MQSPGEQDAEAAQGQGTKTQSQTPGVVRDTEGKEKAPEAGGESTEERRVVSTAVTPEGDSEGATGLGGPTVIRELREGRNTSQSTGG